MKRLIYLLFLVLPVFYACSDDEKDEQGSKTEKIDEAEKTKLLAEYTQILTKITKIQTEISFHEREIKNIALARQYIYRVTYLDPLYENLEELKHRKSEIEKILGI